jgi:nicotinamide-nucleotide amidase
LEYEFFLDRDILPGLAPSDRPLQTVRLKFFGLSESQAASVVDDSIKGLDVMVGYRAHFPEIHVSASVWAEPGADDTLKKVRERLLARLGRYLIAEGDETLAERIGQCLKERGLTVTTAESCTGGLVAQMITAVPGASSWFHRAFITYSNDAKAELLRVPERTLSDFGAVSQQAVVAMARGARARADASYSIALSGIAGPDGGTADKPVGTVELAVDTLNGTWYRPLRMRPYWGRQRIRQASATAGLAVLLKLLEGRESDDPKLILITDDQRAEP